MPKKITPDLIHPNTPAKLIAELQAVGWNERALSRGLGVNILFVSQLIKDGIEPTDKTTKGQATREKLFLPRLAKKKRKKQTHPHRWLPGERKMTIRIGRMAQQTNDAVIRRSER